MINSLKNISVRRNLVTVLAIALIGALATPALAAAQNVSPTDDQYNDTREAIAVLAEDSGGRPTRAAPPIRPSVRFRLPGSTCSACSR